MKKTLTIFLAVALVMFFIGITSDQVMAQGKGKKIGSALVQTMWSVPGDYFTIQDAIDDANVLDGHTILVSPGNHAGALVTKSIEIKGKGNSVIDDGPAHSSGMIQGFRLMAGSDGATISNLQFEVDFGVMNAAAVNDVTIDHCIFLNAVQAISNWGGNGWQITHNEIMDLRTRNGGGIGILIADWQGLSVIDNLIAHNKIYGTLNVYPSDGGGYQGSGIVLYADFRWGRPGTELIAFNRVIKNKVGLVSDRPEVVDVVAFELSQAWGSAGPPVPEPILVRDNSIGYNDFRGTILHIVLSPPALADYNYISRNLGDNRGHGLHPKVFFK